MRTQWRSITAAGLMALTGLTQAAEWPQFRGPGNAGVAEGVPLPSEWSTDTHVAWKVEIPGAAWSCPIVWGDKIFVTTAITEKQQKPRAGGGFGGPGGGGFGRRGRGPEGAAPGGPPPGGDDDQKDAPQGRRGFGGRGGRGGGMGSGGPPPDVVYRFEVHCLDRATGETIWKQLAVERKPTIPMHATNTYASETPVTDGERVYAYFGMHGLYCFDLEGQPVWKKELGSYPMMAGWGTGSSPALDGDRLFIQCDNEKQSFLAAYDKKTGNELWKVDRDERSTWSTPYIWKAAGKTQVVTCGPNRIRSYDPADGKIIWELGGVGGSCNATPVGNEEMLFVGSGGNFGTSPLFAIKSTATGDLSLKQGETSNDGIAWSRTKAGPSMASPLLYQGYLYIVEQRGGMVSCYDAKTGEPAYYRKRIPDAGGCTSSPWASGDKIFCLDEAGQATVLKAGPEFEVLGQNKIGEMCWSTPAFADGMLLLRSIDHLYCIK